METPPTRSDLLAERPADPRLAHPRDPVATRPVLVVSPHLDDAVLSTWGLLDRSPGARVLNVFCAPPEPVQRTEWDATCGFPDSDAAVAARLVEDQKALSELPVETEQLGLIEGQYLPGERGRRDARTLTRTVTSWREEVGDGALIALPAGAGWMPRNLWARISRTRWVLPAIAPHPDHLYVRDAVLEMAPVLGDTEFWLYEELPYRFGGRGDAAVFTLAHNRGLEPERVELPVDRAGKASAVHAYTSQVPRLRGRRGQPLLDDPRGLPRRERYWRLRPA